MVASIICTMCHVYTKGVYREEGMHQLASKNQSGRWNLLENYSKIRFLFDN